LGENTRLRELRRRLDFGQFRAISGNFGLFGAVLHKYAVYTGFLALKFSFTVTISCKRVLSDTRMGISHTRFHRALRSGRNLEMG